MSNKEGVGGESGFSLDAAAAQQHQKHEGTKSGSHMQAVGLLRFAPQFSRLLVAGLIFPLHSSTA